MAANALFDILPNLGLAYGTYVVGTSSPGPAVLAIIANALRFGRPGGLATALGVVTGSLAWGVVSALGLGALLAERPGLLHALGLLGGCYLLWLGWRALHAARERRRPDLREAGASIEDTGSRRLFLHGLGLHLTNAKALFVWMAIIALGLPQGSEASLLPLLIVLGCGVLGVLVFGSYALVFSIPAMTRIYFRSAVPINLTIACLFAAAGGGLLYRSIHMLL